MRGRGRTYFEHDWNDFAADKTHSISQADRAAYTAAYARPGRRRAGWAYFVSFQQAAKDFRELSQTKLTMPVLAIGGEGKPGLAETANDSGGFGRQGRGPAWHQALGPGRTTERD